MKKTQFSLLSMLVVICIATVATSVLTQRHRTRNVTLTTLWSSEYYSYNEPDVRIYIVSNANERPMFTLILQQKNLDQNVAIKQPKEWHSGMPLKGLKSTWKIHTTTSAVKSGSGIWIDGKKQAVGNGLTAVYISDEEPARTLDIDSLDHDQLMVDAKALRPQQFIEKWVTSKKTPAPIAMSRL